MENYLKRNVKTIYLRKDIITTEILAIDVCGPLNDIRAAQFAEGGEDAFISRVPHAKSSNSKTKNITRLVLSFKVGFEMHILKLFTGNSFFQSFLAVLKGTAHIDNGHMVVVLTISGRTGEPLS
jgi:hypothetical protein